MHPRRDGSRSGMDGAFWGVSACFVLSGVAGLVYQMVWMRHLSTIFGTSELAIVTVLVAYMGGLAAGAGMASRVVGRLRRPIRIYAGLEGLIAVSALLVPVLLEAVGGLHRVLLGGQPAPPSDGGVVEALALLGLGCVVLLIPTACMGATLPILAAGVVRRTRQIGRRVGWLYALNTIGAAAGAVLAAFVLIPRLGLWQTSLVAVGLNVFVALLGWWIALRAGAPRVDEEDKAEGGRASVPRGLAAVILGVMCLSGALSFAYEVLWSRLLAFVLGGSLYAFATMLASFLAGIALGGLLGARLAADRRRSCYWLAGCEIAAGLLTAWIYLEVSSESFAGARSGEASLGSLAWLCAVILLPATVCIGATFPLAVRSLCAEPGLAGRAAGRVYSWNTAGAIAGAVGAGFFLLPALGFEGAFKVAIVGNLALGTVVLAAMSPRATVPAAAAVTVALAVLVLWRPPPPLALMTVSPLAGEGSPRGIWPELVHHAVGRSATVVVLKRRGSYLLRTNGLPEAEVFAKGGDKLSYTRIRWLPALPKVLRPETKSLLVVGFGGGALLEKVPPGIENIDVVEIEEEVVAANRALSGRRAIDPFRDRRINVIVNDVRGALRLTTKRYDAIVSQPSHPWTAGASHLYTREFFELARDHLSDDGVFVQWLGAQFVDEGLLRSFAATMLEVFPHVQLYLVADNFLFAGSGGPLDERFLEGAGPDGSLVHLSGYARISYVEDVLAALQLDEEGCRSLADGYPVITDNRNLMATETAIGRRTEHTMDKEANLKRVLGPIHFLNRKSPLVLERPAGQSVDFPYLVRLLVAEGTRQVDLAALIERAVPPAERAVSRAHGLAGRDPQRVLEVLRETIAAFPQATEARALDAQLRLAMARQQWTARGLGPLPREFEVLVATENGLRHAVDALTPEQRAVLRANHWARTGQRGRIAEVAATLQTFTDHRDSLYQSAMEARVQLLLDPAGRSESQQDEEAWQAAELLDHLLALPLIDNRALILDRIALAQRFSDLDYQIAAGWIMASKLAGAPANAPEAMKEMYRAPLGAILAPYARRDERGRLVFSSAAIKEFYEAVNRQIGVRVFPEEFQP